MAKFKNVGFVGVPKAKPDNRYIKIKLPEGMEKLVLKSGDFLTLMKPRKSEKQSDEQFAELLQWKRFDILQVTDE